MANKKGSRQLTWTDRISIEALKKAGHSVIEIAEQLGVQRSTIYNELKRGEYMHRNSDYTETLSYSPNKAQMKAEELSILTKYGIVQERVAALMTDSVRANLLECAGYKTQLLEFIDIAHSPKNILIRASKANISKEKKEKSLVEVQNLMNTFSFEPTLYNLLSNDNLI